jgi:hypothetical protein
MTKFRFFWSNLKDPEIYGMTRWLDFEKIPHEEIIQYVAKFQFLHREFDFKIQKVVIDDPLEIEGAKIENVEVLDEKTKRIYQRLPLNA